MSVYSFRHEYMRDLSRVLAFFVWSLLDWIGGCFNLEKAACASKKVAILFQVDHHLNSLFPLCPIFFDRPKKQAGVPSKFCFDRIFEKKGCENSYHEVVFSFFFVAHSHDSQHQVDEVERPKENDYGEKYNTHGTAGGHNLYVRRQNKYIRGTLRRHKSIHTVC